MDDHSRDGVEVDSEQLSSDTQDYLETEEEDDPSINLNEDSEHSEDHLVHPDSADGSQPHTVMVVQQSGAEDDMENSQGSMIDLGKEFQIEEESTLKMMANLAEQVAAKVAGGLTDSVIVKIGNSHQTVTVVPSGTNPGEVSYVLYLSQAEDINKTDINCDMSLYGFQDEKKPDGVLEEEVRTDNLKVHAVCLAPRKSQMSMGKHKCNQCNYTSPKLYLLARHMRTHSDERPYQCTMCERGFKTRPSLQNHINVHTGTRPHRCKSCDSCFTTSGELVRHVRYKHTGERPHRCTECNYASVELSKLRRHMQGHTGERPFKCSHCTYAAPDIYKLKRHLRVHSPEKVHCDICQACFSQPSSLKIHKLIHSENRPVFECQFCPTTCGRKIDLRIHVEKLHSCDRTFNCNKCGKIFVDRYTFRMHTKTHAGEKCFKCDICPYAAASKRHLDSHILVHTDQKPYECDECDQSFRQKQLLRRHKRIHHDPHYVRPVPKEKTNQCALCGKAFRHKGNLIRHLATHPPRTTVEDKKQVVIFQVIQVPHQNGTSSTDGQFMIEGQPVILSSNEHQDCAVNSASSS